MTARMMLRTLPNYVQVRCPACGHFLAVGNGRSTETTCRFCGVTYEYES